MELENRVALVTGGSRGIGRAVVEALANAGMHVTFTYHKQEEKAKAVAAETNATPIKLDIMDVASINKIVKATYATRNRIDLLVNNAGVYSRNEFLDSTEEIWDTTLDTNLKGTYFMAKAVAEKMNLHKRGTIINVASDAGIKTRGIEYGISKEAIIYLTKALSKTLPDLKINCVCPSYTDTNMAAWNQDQCSKEEIEQKHGRVNTPEEVAQAILSLVISESSGRIIQVKNGVVTDF